MRPQPPRTEGCLQSVDKLIDASPGFGGNRDAPRKSPAINRGQHRVFQQIDLVESDECLFAEGIEFLDHAIDLLHLFDHPRMTEIYHVNKEISFADFLERSLEGLDQSMRQLAQEPDCIRQQNTLFVRKAETAGCWIKRGKKFIDREDISARH